MLNDYYYLKCLGCFRLQMPILLLQFELVEEEKKSVFSHLMSYKLEPCAGQKFSATAEGWFFSVTAQSVIRSFFWMLKIYTIYCFDGDRRGARQHTALRHFLPQPLPIIKKPWYNYIFKLYSSIVFTRHTITHKNIYNYKSTYKQFNLYHILYLS